MQFLLKATRESRGKKRLKHILILTCRTLAIAALVFAVARPLRRRPPRLGQRQGRHRRPAPRPLRRAWRRSAGDGLPATPRDHPEQSRDAPSANSAAPASCSSTAPPASPRRSRPRTSSRSSPPPPPPTPPPTCPPAVDRASTTSRTPPGRTEIWIASDLQAPDWAPDADRWKTVRAGLDRLPQAPASASWP